MDDRKVVWWLRRPFGLYDLHPLEITVLKKSYDQGLNPTERCLLVWVIWTQLCEHFLKEYGGWVVKPDEMTDGEVEAIIGRPVTVERRGPLRLENVCTYVRGKVLTRCKELGIANVY